MPYFNEVFTTFAIRDRPGPKVIKPLMFNSTEHEISTVLEKVKMINNRDFFYLKFSDPEFNQLINVKILRILKTFMRRINFILS